MKWSVLFTRRWLFATLLVLLACAVMVRLGFWQLDRLAQRRAFNARVSEQMAQPPLDLNDAPPEADLAAMEYRTVRLSGRFDYEHQVAIRNQAWENRLGVHLLTPLRLDDSEQAVMVDRGWIPLEDFQAGDLSPFDEAVDATIEGVLRRSQSQPSFGGRADAPLQPGEWRAVWNFVTLEWMAQQMPYPLLNVYVVQAPEDGRDGLPYRHLPEVELTEGPHLGYAVQWFLFAAILFLGYPFYVRKESSRP